MVTEDREFTEADVKAELEKFEWSTPVKQITNLKVKMQRTAL